MVFRKINIAVFLLTLSSFCCNKSFAQSNLASNNPHNWIEKNNDLPKEDLIVLAIESLKMAEANMADSATAYKLESIGYLSITASGFQNSQSDKYQRKGWWMLSFPIAIKYGLVINSTIDERLDLVKSTIAAYNYWLYLKAQNVDLDIAELVFLASPMAVSKFNFDSLSFPEQYVKQRATKKQLEVVKELYGKHHLQNYVGPSQSIVSVNSDKKISFESIHHFLQIPTSEIQRLNPQWISNTYNPLYGNLLLPASYHDAFEKKMSAMEQKSRDDEIVLIAANEKRLKQLLGDIPDLKTYKPIRYKVKMGDNLGKIAQRHHVKISSIRSWNELRGDRIYAGQKLTIYVPINQKQVVAKSKPKAPTKSKLKAGEYREYTVQSGDTLWDISQRYEKISAEEIMKDNGIDANISPGQVLKIRKIE